MKIKTIFITTVLITLFATIAFCENGKVYVKNSTREMRTVKVKATVITGYRVDSRELLRPGGNTTFDLTLQKPFEFLENWRIRVYTITGLQISEGYLTRDKDGFDLKTPGACFTCEKSGKDMIITITR